LGENEIEVSSANSEAGESEDVIPAPYSVPLLQAQVAAAFRQACTREALDEAISELLPQLTQDNAEAWFRTRLGLNRDNLLQLHI